MTAICAVRGTVLNYAGSVLLLTPPKVGVWYEAQHTQPVANDVATQPPPAGRWKQQGKNNESEDEHATENAQDHRD